LPAPALLPGNHRHVFQPSVLTAAVQCERRWGRQWDKPVSHHYLRRYFRRLHSLLVKIYPLPPPSYSRHGRAQNCPERTEEKFQHVQPSLNSLNTPSPASTTSDSRSNPL
jgi:hypothetical protein